MCLYRGYKYGRAHYLLAYDKLHYGHPIESPLHTDNIVTIGGVLWFLCHGEQYGHVQYDGRANVELWMPQKLRPLGRIATKYTSYVIMLHLWLQHCRALPHC